MLKQIKALTRKEIKDLIVSLTNSENIEDVRLAHTLQYFLNVTVLDPSSTPHFVIEEDDHGIDMDDDIIIDNNGNVSLLSMEKDINWLNPNDIKPAIIPEAIAPKGMENTHGTIINIIN